MSIGISELLVIAVVVAILIRPNDWPKVVRKLGYWYGRIQKWNEDLSAGVRAMGDNEPEPDNDDRVERT